jgi:hypothetical protein
MHAIGPAQKMREFVSMGPAESPEIARSDLFGVQSLMGLDAPPQIRAAPWAQAITFGESPDGP